MGVVSNLTTISVTKDTYKKLKKLGDAGDSLNDVIVRLLQIEYEERQRREEDEWKRSH